MPDTRDIAIYTQVAYKEVFQNYRDADLTDPDTSARFKTDLTAAYVLLTEAIEENQKAARASQPSVAQVVHDAFPGSTSVAPDGTAAAPHPAGERSEQSGYSLEIANREGAHGPIPAWAVSAAQSQGIRKVWDNRNPDGSGPTGNKAWFKEFVSKSDGERGVKPRAIYPPQAA